ncbi:unnamed protein product [Larinioides sclopetarius]|uniref:NADH dehydrogenase [ubiquinone] 1 beta subcomplex subunit 11, mitochondrial n=1 Tax=Larinioides sclopetarius TaxID=280406 RepID=A0AAV2APG9_9ARAC
MALSRISLAYPAIFRPFQRYSITKIALISTSKKSKDTLAFPEDVFPKKQPPAPKTVEEFAETKNPKFWVSYGYDEENYENDRHEHKVINFFLLTVLVCGGTFILAYNPDLHLQPSAALHCVTPREYTARIPPKRRNDAIIILEPVTLVQLLRKDVQLLEATKIGFTEKHI